MKINFSGDMCKIRQVFNYYSFSNYTNKFLSHFKIILYSTREKCYASDCNNTMFGHEI